MQPDTAIETASRRRSSAAPDEPAPATPLSAARVAAWALPFALVLYLAFRGGGYDADIHQEAGVAVWLAIVAGVALRALPLAPLPRGAIVSLALLAGFAAWTGLSAIWSESVERSLEAFALVATYVGVFALALFTCRRWSLRTMIGAVGAAIVVVALAALGSRLHPDWFPDNSVAEFLPSVEARLNYPLTSWNGLGALMAMGLPMMLLLAVESRRVLTQALATASVPVLALTLYYTLSRGGAIAAGLAVVAFLALHPRRLEALPTLVIAAVGAAAAIALASQRDALANGLTDATASSQGDQMLAIVAVICVAVALARAGLTAARKRGLVPEPDVPPRTARRVLAGAAVALIVAAVVAGAPSKLSNAWRDFKAAPSPTLTEARLASASGNGRYQYWRSEVEAMKTAPVGGIGAGTFELWWARESTIFGFTKFSHSLYFEALGETGIVGFALVVAFLVSILVVGARRLREAVSDRRRALIGAAIAAAIAFDVAVGTDWNWQVPVIPVAFLLVAAALVCSRSGDPDDVAGDVEAGGGGEPRPSVPVAARVGIAVAGVAVAVFLTSSAIGNVLINASQSDSRAQDLDGALAAARHAATAQPYAATPQSPAGAGARASGRPRHRRDRGANGDRKGSLRLAALLHTVAHRAQAGTDRRGQGRLRDVPRAELRFADLPRQPEPAAAADEWLIRPPRCPRTAPRASPSGPASSSPRTSRSGPTS